MRLRSPAALPGVTAMILAATGTPALSGLWDGVYHPSAEASCEDEAGAIRIEEGIFHGVGLQCEITQPVNVLDIEATLYTMVCSNDAETWSERAMIMRDAQADGIFMIWNGYVFRYARCGTEEEAPGEVNDDGDDSASP